MSAYAVGDFVMVRRGPDAHRRGRVIAVHRPGPVQGYDVLLLDSRGVLMVGEGNLKRDPTAYGFQYGPAEVVRLFHGPLHGRGDAYVVGITTDAGHEVQVAVSATGRSIRVWRRMRDQTTNIELKPEEAQP